jgi:hypothetical protein
MSDFCRKEIEEHIDKVQMNVQKFNEILTTRVQNHDKSKFDESEFPFFAKYTDTLKNVKYGSAAYEKALKKLNPAVQHHYKFNTHHPEHYKNGINDMSLFDLIEMLMDWEAASHRMRGGDIFDSLEINKKRFDIPDFLICIFKKTIEELKEPEQKC